MLSCFFSFLEIRSSLSGGTSREEELPYPDSRVLNIRAEADMFVPQSMLLEQNYWQVDRVLDCLAPRPVPQGDGIGTCVRRKITVTLAADSLPIEAHVSQRRTLSSVDGRVLVDGVLDRACRILTSRVGAVAATFAAVSQSVQMPEITAMGSTYPGRQWHRGGLYENARGKYGSGTLVFGTLG